MIKPVHMFSSPNSFTRIAEISAASILLFTIYLIYAWKLSGLTGPTWASDEIGYLTKAAFIAGYSIDKSTPYHAGYSFFIAPLFNIFDDPLEIWRGVQAVNSALFTLSFLFTYILCRPLYPNCNYRRVLLACFVASLYPSWFIMAAHSFSTPAIVLLFTLSLLSLLLSGRFPILLLLHSATAGLLYWVHPTGLAVAGSSILILLILWIKKHHRGYTFSSLVVVAALLVVYRYIVHPYIVNGMTAEGYGAYLRYPQEQGIINALLGDPNYWRNLPLNILGQFGALVIATFGVIVYSLQNLVYSVLAEFKKPFLNNISSALMTRLFLVIAIAAVFCIAVLTITKYTTNPATRSHVWIHTRYIEPFVFSAVAIGILGSWRARWAVVSALLLGLAALAFIYYGELGTQPGLVTINIVSFWPFWLDQKLDFFVWMVWGIVGISLVYLLGKKFGIMLVLPLIGLSVLRSTESLYSQFAFYNKPSSLISFVRANFAEGACIGWDSAPKRVKGFLRRRDLHTFYFYDYEFERMSREEWSRACDGPLLTQGGYMRNDKGFAKVVARDKKNNIQILMKQHAIRDTDFKVLRSSEFVVDPKGESEALFPIISDRANN